MTESNRRGWARAPGHPERLSRTMASTGLWSGAKQKTEEERAERATEAGQDKRDSYRLDPPYGIAGTKWSLF